MKLSTEGSRRMRSFLENYYRDASRLETNTSLVQILNAMQEAGEDIYINYSRGRWLDVDSPDDLQL